MYCGRSIPGTWFGVGIGVSMGMDVSIGGTVSVGITGGSLEGIAAGVGEEQDARRRRIMNERRIRVVICLCMDGF